jgi:hypothetical protein
MAFGTSRNHVVTLIIPFNSTMLSQINVQWYATEQYYLISTTRDVLLFNLLNSLEGLNIQPSPSIILLVQVMA